MAKTDSFNKKKTIKDIIKISLSNILKLLSGVLVGFLLPKIIGVTDYGYYKTFALYISYVGLFHFGIEDGIYLKFGDKNFDELDKGKFRFYSRFLIVLELSIAVIGLIISFCFLSGEFRFIFACVAAYLFFANITTYYQFISQITQRFTELTNCLVIQSTLTAITVVSLWALHKFANYFVTYYLFTILYISIIGALTVWYIWKYRDITFGKSIKFEEGKKDIFEFLRIGFPLLIANLCSSLILSIDRQFVNIFWPLSESDTYSIYAFAYSMLSLITTATSAIATVIYPVLKRATAETLKVNYTKLVSIILILVSACLFLYYPLFLFVNWFLPDYSNSLEIFRIVFPGLAISASITIVIANYYKVLGKSFRFFIENIIVLCLAIVADFIAYYVFKTTTSISWASIVVMGIWYIVSDFYFVKNYHVNWWKNLLYLILIFVGFYCLSLINNVYIEMAIYPFVFLTVTGLIYWHDIRDFCQMRKKRKQGKPV
ncbi:MAG: hypothetical protein LKE31_02805 [Bacilli bacterium]|jgi:O-antigen/teichoic acid export membrane protein|nr:hypothetical protein [Bacilli bacterium]